MEHVLTDKEIHRRFNRPNLSNDLSGQDAVAYEEFLEEKRKELSLNVVPINVVLSNKIKITSKL